MRLAAVVVILSFVSLSASASATLLEEGANAVSSIAGVPEAPPPAVPVLPKVVPAPSEVASDQSGSQQPVAVPSPPPDQSSEGSAPSLVDSGAGVADRATGGAARVASDPTRLLRREAAPSAEQRSSGSSPSAAQGEVQVAAGPGSRSVRPAVAAPLHVWLAHVWPAIALGPFGGPIGVVAATRLLALEIGVPLPGAAERDSSLTVAGDPPVGLPSTPNPAGSSHSNPAPFFSPQGGGMSLLAVLMTVLAALVGLVSLARLTVGEDLFSLRWLR